MEDSHDRFLYLTVGHLLDTFFFCTDVADWHLSQHDPTLNLLPMCFHRSLAEQAYLELAHGALETEQKAIVQETRIVDSVVVDDQCTGHSTEINQMVPVTVVPSQARRFQCKHGANRSRAHRGE